MTTETTGYNGWKNYETWTIGLFITNDESDYTYWQHQTHEAWTDADYLKPEYFTRSEDARIRLADALKDWAEDNVPGFDTAEGPAPMYLQLLNAALSEVDWIELADNLLADTEGYERAD